MVKSWPLVPLDAFELTFRLAASSQCELMVSGSPVGAAWTFGRAFASAMIRLIEQERHLGYVKLAVARDERKHASRDVQIERPPEAPVFVATLTVEELPGVGEIVPEVEQSPAGAGQIACGRLPRRPA